MTRLLVTGSRDWLDDALLRRRLDLLASLTEATVLVHGACPLGADVAAEKWALERGLHLERHPADWINRGLAAGPERNQRMADLGAELCVAFPTKHSKGTRDMVRRAQAAGIPTLVYQGER